MTNVLQSAAAAATVDPNTLQASVVAPPAPAPAPMTDQQQYEDEWAKNPAGVAPVRTWLSPTARAQPDGEYLNAWYDDIPTQPSAAPAPAATAAAPAEVVATVAPPAAPAATPAPAAATSNDPVVNAGFVDNTGGGGGGGD